MSHLLKTVIVGCGTVGGATARHLIESHDRILQRYDIDVQLSAVVDRDLTNARAIRLPEDILSCDLGSVLASGDIDVVIELVGGIDVAHAIISQALEAGAHVVTANKALLAHRGAELFALARARGLSLAFEASCGGGIPLVRALVDGLAGNRIDGIYGIVNGTCNYILSEMIARSISYDQALKEAQASGLAEADPTLDVGGHDSGHKIAIMASLAFGIQVDFDEIPIEGIDSLNLVDVAWATRLGYVPKLLAIAERQDGNIALRVRPVFVPRHHPLAWVGGPFNAVSVYSYPTGHTMYYGRGAGGSATAGAIVADVVSVATGSYQRLFATAKFWPDRSSPQSQTSEVIRGRYYVRTVVEDEPGVLAEMALRYKDHGISIASVHQDELSAEDTHATPVVIVTHPAAEPDLMAAVAEINALPCVTSPCAVITIIDEPDEHLIEY